ncbi:reverse transcriptase domain-containing protein [Tanacetum coccineum]
MKQLKRVDVIDIACEEYVQEVLETSESGNPTSTSDLMIDSRSLSFTPFGGSDFLMEEIDEFLENDDSIPPGVDGIYDSEGDTVYLEELLSVINSDPNLPPSPVCEINVPEKVKSSCEDPPDLETKDLPSHLEYAFLEGDDKLPSEGISDIKGINPQFCTHKILMEENAKPVVQHQRRVNPKIHEVIKQEVIKLLDAGLIYPISDSPWVSPVHCVPKKGGITVVKNEDNELIPTRLVTGWRVCIDYRKLNDATRKDHFPLPFMDQMLERLAGNEYYCFLDGFSGYFQIPIDPLDQEKTTFTCPYGTFAYRRMPFGLCNAPGTFQRCMVAIFHDMIEKTMEVFMDDFSVFGDSFFFLPLPTSAQNAQRCETPISVLNWGKVPPIMVRVFDSFLGHADSTGQVYSGLFQNRPAMDPTLLEKETLSLGTLGTSTSKRYTMTCKTMTEAQGTFHYKRKKNYLPWCMLSEIPGILVLSKSIVYYGHRLLSTWLAKQDAKPSFLVDFVAPRNLMS